MEADRQINQADALAEILAAGGMDARRIYELTSDAENVWESVERCLQDLEEVESAAKRTPDQSS